MPGESEDHRHGRAPDRALYPPQLDEHLRDRIAIELEHRADIETGGEDTGLTGNDQRGIVPRRADRRGEGAQQLEVEGVHRGSRQAQLADVSVVFEDVQHGYSPSPAAMIS